jgi:hypothetical protein
MDDAIGAILEMITNPFTEVMCPIPPKDLLNMVIGIGVIQAPLKMIRDIIMPVLQAKDKHNAKKAEKAAG